MMIIKILVLIAAWLFFYKILTARKKRLAGIKATIITLLFASLIFRLGTDIYGFVDRAFFSLDKQGEIALKVSPLKIPLNQDSRYCNQFTDQYSNRISKISEKNGDKYCGEFWRFEKNTDIILPYKMNNSDQVIYWASPYLKIYGSKSSLEQTMKLEKK